MRSLMDRYGYEAVLDGMQPSFEAYAAPTQHPLYLGLAALLSLAGQDAETFTPGMRVTDVTSSDGEVLVADHVGRSVIAGPV